MFIHQSAVERNPRDRVLKPNRAMGEERMQKEMSAPLRRAPRRLRRDAFRLAQPAEPSQLLLRGARSVPRDRDLFSELLRLRLRLLRASLRVGGGRAADGRLDFASSRAFQSHSRVGELGVEPLRARDSLVRLPRGRARGLLERDGRSLLRRELVAERRERGLGGGGAFGGVGRGVILRRRRRRCGFAHRRRHREFRLRGFRSRGRVGRRLLRGGDALAQGRQFRFRVGRRLLRGGGVCGVAIGFLGPLELLLELFALRLDGLPLLHRALELHAVALRFLRRFLQLACARGGSGLGSRVSAWTRRGEGCGRSLASWFVVFFSLSPRVLFDRGRRTGANATDLSGA
eukprot:29312-Pelagococcus_subviridis.AAC.5